MARRERRVSLPHPELVLLVAGAALLRLPTVLSRSPLNYDDSVYLASVGALRDGGVPFRDVFSSQGPAFLPLLWLADGVGLRAVWAPRLLPLAAGLALVVVVHRLAGRASDRAGAALAALLVVTSGAVVFATGRLEADGVTSALGASAVLAASAARTPRGNVVTALLLGVGLAVKSLFVLPAAVAALWLVGRRWGWRAAGAVGAGAAVVLLLLALPWGLGAVWDQYVALHLDARASPDLAANADVMWEVLWGRDRPLVATAGACAAVLLVGWVRGSATPRQGRDLAVAAWIWLGASVAVILGHDPLLFQHLVVIVPPVAVLAARHRPPLPVALAVLLLLVPGHGHRTGWRVTAPGRTANEVAVLELLERVEPPDGRVVSDEPALARLAGRTSPGSVVDVSHVRIDVGDLATADVIAAAHEPGVCVVLFWSGRLDRLPGLRAALSDYRSVHRDGREQVLLRDDCELRSPVTARR